MKKLRYAIGLALALQGLVVLNVSATRVLFIGTGGGADGDVMEYLVNRYGRAPALGEDGVTMRSGAASSASNAVLVDVVVISSSIGSVDVRNKFEDSPTGVLTWEEALFKQAVGDFYMASTSSKPTNQVAVTVVDNSHFITEVFPTGIVTIVDGAGVQFSVGNGTIATGAVVLAEQVGVPGNKALFVAETGAGLLGDGTAGKPAVAAGRRVMFPMTDASFGALNESGLRLFGRAVDWAAGRDTLGYWRMEEDDDPGGGVSVPDAQGNGPLTRASGDLDNDKTNSVMTRVLANGLTNSASLNGDGSVNGVVGSYSALNAGSITVEFFARTAEGAAGLFTRSSGTAGEVLGTNGLSIVDPDNLDVRYVVSAGASNTITNTWSGLYDTDEVWHHYAFAYDQTSGVGTLYIDGITWARNDGSNGCPLAWGAGTNAIKAGWNLDGGAPYSGTDDGLFDELMISDEALGPCQLLYQSPLIAGDSFAVNGLPGGYVQSRIHANGANTVAVAGTVGFSASHGWAGDDTSNTEARNDGPNGGGLTHAMLTGEVRGTVRLKAKDSRNQRRRLNVTVPDAPVYYMSMLLHGRKIEPDLDMSLGFSTVSNDRNRGIHAGFAGDKLAVFAGGTNIVITPAAFETNTTYLTVVELQPNPSNGVDTVTAYVAAEGETALRWAGQLEVETFTAPADLEYLKFRLLGNGVSEDRLWWVDEARLATTVADLGIVPALLGQKPERAGTTLIVR